MSDHPPDWWQASDGNWYPPRGSKLPPPPVHRSTFLWAAGGFAGLLSAWLFIVAATKGGSMNSGRILAAVALGIVAAIAIGVNLNRPR